MRDSMDEFPLRTFACFLFLFFHFNLILSFQQNNSIGSMQTWMIKHYNSFKLCTLSVIEMMCYDKYNFFFCNYTTWFTRFFCDIKKWSLENYQRKISQNSLANHHHYVLTDINFIFSDNDAEISHNLCNVVSSHRQQKKSRKFLTMIYSFHFIVSIGMWINVKN